VLEDRPEPLYGVTDGAQVVDRLYNELEHNPGNRTEVRQLAMYLNQVVFDAYAQHYHGMMAAPEEVENAYERIHLTLDAAQDAVAYAHTGDSTYLDSLQNTLDGHKDELTAAVSDVPVTRRTLDDLPFRDRWEDAFRQKVRAHIEREVARDPSYTDDLLVLAVESGGVEPAGIVCEELEAMGYSGFDVEAVRYSSQTRMDREVIAPPQADEHIKRFAGRNVLVVDDFRFNGSAIGAVERYVEGFGPATVAEVQFYVHPAPYLFNGGPEVFMVHRADE